MAGRDLFATEEGKDLFATDKLGLLPDAEGNLVPSMLPDAEGNLEPVTKVRVGPKETTVAENVAEFAQDTSRIVGEKISEVASPVAKSAVGIAAGAIGLGGKAVEAGIATKEGVKVGEAALTAFPIGAGIGAGISLLGKTALPTYLARSTRKIPKAISDFLFTASKSPAKVAAIEGVLAAASGAADVATTQITGSETAGTVAGFVTPVALASKVAKHIMPAYMAKEDFVDATLARELRDNPEILKAAESNLEAAVKGDYAIRLDLLTKDKTISKATRQLSEASPQLERLFDQSTDAIGAQLAKSIDAATSGKLTPEQAASQIDNMLAKASLDKDNLLSQLPDINKTTAQVSNDAFNGLIDKTYLVAKQTINKAYGKLALDVELGVPDKNLLMELANDLGSKATAGGLSLKKSGVKPIIDELRKEAKAVGAVSKGGYIPTAASLNDIRGLALEMTRIRSAKGKNTEKLRDAVSGLTRLLEKHPELESANAIYREFKGVFDNGQIAKYFSNTGTGEKVTGIESFTRDFFMSGRPIERADELRRFVGSTFAKRKGIAWADVQIAANDAFVAKLRSGGEVTPAAWKNFVAKNRQSLKEFGLEEGFKSYANVAAAAKEIEGKLGKTGLRNLSLAKFGFNSRPEALANAARTNRTALVKEIADLPEGARGGARKAVIDSLVKDSKGVILKPDAVKDALTRHGKAFGMTNNNIKSLTALAAHLDIPRKGGVAFNEFQAAMQRDPSVFARMRSVALERITRPTLKVIRAGSFLKDVSGVREIRESLHEALLTESGARRILQMARKNEQSALVIRGILYGRAGFLQSGEADDLKETIAGN